MSGFAPDYIQVNERLGVFRERYPEGSLQAEIVELTETRVVMKAYAYRTPDDTRPGIGHSSLEIPGKTPYTKGSELENAETSAWGRALAALGFEVKRAIATAEEVESKAEEPRPIRRAPVALPAEPPAPTPFTFSSPPDPMPDGIEPLPLPEFGTRPPKAPALGDMCAKHPGERWKGEPGDLYHRLSEGGYCRPPGQPRKGAQK